MWLPYFLHTAGFRATINKTNKFCPHGTAELRRLASNEPERQQREQGGGNMLWYQRNCAVLCGRKGWLQHRFRPKLLIWIDNLALFCKKNLLNAFYLTVLFCILDFFTALLAYNLRQLKNTVTAYSCNYLFGSSTMHKIMRLEVKSFS